MFPHFGQRTISIQHHTRTTYKNTLRTCPVKTRYLTSKTQTTRLNRCVAFPKAWQKEASLLRRWNESSTKQEQNASQKTQKKNSKTSANNSQPRTESEQQSSQTTPEEKPSKKKTSNSLFGKETNSSQSQAPKNHERQSYYQTLFEPPLTEASYQYNAEKNA